VEEYEASEGMRFAWVTRIRPDTAIVRPVASIQTLNSKFFYLSSQAFIDHVGIFGRGLATHFFTFSDRFFSQCPKGVLDWRTNRGITDIQKFMFEHHPFLGNQMLTPIPVVIIRAEEKGMTDRCNIFVNQYPSVYGKGHEALSKCMLDTRTDPVDVTSDTNVSIPYRYPLKNVSSSSLDLFPEDCQALFKGKHSTSTPLPPSSARNTTLQEEVAQTSKVAPKKKAKKSKDTKKKLKTVERPHKTSHSHKRR